MSRIGPSVFLERQSYRRRRMLDAARFLPILGALLLAVPLLWPKPGEAEAAPVAMSDAVLYVFGVWALLILLALLFGLAQHRWVRDARTGAE